MPKSRSRRRPSSSGRARPPAGRTRIPVERRPLVPEPAPGLRGKVERSSAPVLLWLTAKPKLLLPLLVAVLLIAGLAAPPAVGAPLLVLLALLIGWLSYLAWPTLQTAPRLLRAATVGLLLAAIGGKLSG